MFDILVNFFQSSGFVAATWQQVGMIGLSFVLMYLAIKKKYEPLLLLPIAFGMFLVNLPGANLMQPPQDDLPGGLLYYFSQGIELGIYPPLIF